MVTIAVVGTRGFPGVQGGVETHCEQLYTRLAAYGCNITVFTRKPYVKQDIRSYKGVTLIPVNCPKHKLFEAIIHTFKSILIAARQRPNILHIQGIGPSLFAPLGRILGMKVVVTNHGENYKHLKWGFSSRLFLRFCEAVGMLFSNRIIAITEQIALTVKKKYGKSPVIIPNGVNIATPSTAEDTLENFNIKKHNYILAVGRFVPEKGFHDLINAFNQLQIKKMQKDFLFLDDWKLVIVGCADHEDSYSSDLIKLAKTSTNVILTGYLTGEPLRQLYSHAGLFVLPSYYEGLPIALLEALSYGLSCIVSDIPANKNMELSLQRFFRPGDIKSIAQKMEEFIKSPLSEEEGHKQREMITEKFSWEKIALKTMEVYNSTLNN